MFFMSNYHIISESYLYERYSRVVTVQNRPNDALLGIYILFRVERNRHGRDVLLLKK